MIAATPETGNEVARFTRRRLCSECWGKLRYDPTRGGYLCDTPGCSCTGSVAVATVEIRESTSERDLHKAREALAEALGLPGRVTPKSEAALLKEMGF